eukprot:4385445-Amphidinium_carterae.1
MTCVSSTINGPLPCTNRTQRGPLDDHTLYQLGSTSSSSRGCCPSDPEADGCALCCAQHAPSAHTLRCTEHSTREALTLNA